MKVDYDHSQNRHTAEGPAAAVPILFPNGIPNSVLDVGCGTGTWLRAILNRGKAEVFGIDGVGISVEKLQFDPNSFRTYDLSSPIDLGRKFDVVLCLEVAEHLDSCFAPVLVKTLTRHSEKVIFSAACPGQAGQHHVNCQWPEYWQKLFNEEGFVCEDPFRWTMWSMKEIEPWYRQNMFLARRDPNGAGRERRIPAVMHPAIFGVRARIGREPSSIEVIRQIEQGCMPARWYFSAGISGLFAKVMRHTTKRNEE